MKFLEVFNKIAKGDYALTDEAIYASIKNGDEFVPLYGGNQYHRTTDRRISITAKTKKGIPITIFSGEGIIISLDGSAGSMTYKNGERFALNHHAGFITLREDAKEKVNLEFFSIYLQSFYQSLSISDGSKTLSLSRVYSEEFNLPSYGVQCSVLASLKSIGRKIDALTQIKNSLYILSEKSLNIDYKSFQGKEVSISTCIDYLSGNSGLTEETVYQTLQINNQHYSILSSATEESTMMGEIPMCIIKNHPLKVFEDKPGLLVTRNGKAGHTRFLQPGKYTINDHAYILYLRDNSPYIIDLKWLAIQYREEFLSYASSADNGTWNMSGFFEYTKIDVPNIEEQEKVVRAHEEVQQRIRTIEAIESKYYNLLTKEISN